MNFNKSRKLMWLCFAAGIGLIAFGTGHSEKVNLVFAAFGTIVFVAGLIQAFVFYRCNHCGHSLMNVRGAVPDFCPKCGEALKPQE